MAFSYDDSLGTSLGQLRFLISDTDSSNAIYNDAELNGVLGMEPNIFRAAALALRSRLTNFITKAIRYSLGTEVRGSLSIDRRRIVDNFEKAIVSFEHRALSTPDEVFDRLDFNIDQFGRDVSNYQGDNTPIDVWVR